jgi:hypothetical protein
VITIKPLGAYRRPRRRPIDVRAEARRRLDALFKAREPAERGQPNVDYHAPGLDPEDVTGGNGDG